MKLDIGQTIQVVANLGVVGGLIFLAYEINQNTTQLMRGEMNATMEQYSSWRHTIASNADLAQLWTDGLRGVDQLSDAEQIRFELMLDDSFWLNYQFWDRARVGAIRRDWEALALGGTIEQINNSEAAKVWWEENKSAFPPGYVAAVESGL